MLPGGMLPSANRPSISELRIGSFVDFEPVRKPCVMKQRVSRSRRKGARAEWKPGADVSAVISHDAYHEQSRAATENET